MKNCFTMALLLYIKKGFKGRIRILAWDGIIPHFMLVEEHWITHYCAKDKSLPWYRMLHYEGTYRMDWGGEP